MNFGKENIIPTIILDDVPTQMNVTKDQYTERRNNAGYDLRPAEDFLARNVTPTFDRKAPTCTFLLHSERNFDNPVNRNFIPMEDPMTLVNSCSHPGINFSEKQNSVGYESCPIEYFRKVINISDVVPTNVFDTSPMGSTVPSVNMNSYPMPITFTTYAAPSVNCGSVGDVSLAAFLAKPTCHINEFTNNTSPMLPNMPQNSSAPEFSSLKCPPQFPFKRDSAAIYGIPATIPCARCEPVALADGTIQLRLRDGIRIDITLERAIRVLNQRNMVAITLSGECTKSALIHPNGRLLQKHKYIDIVTYNGMGMNKYVRYAKIRPFGVSFASEPCKLAYVVKTTGTSNIKATFERLIQDPTLKLFYNSSLCGPSRFQDADDIIKSSAYFCYADGTEVYCIDNYRIKQSRFGLVSVTRLENRSFIRTNAWNGSSILKCKGLHCTVSMGRVPHFYVRHNEKYVFYDGAYFSVSNDDRVAGFNENDFLIIN